MKFDRLTLNIYLTFCILVSLCLVLSIGNNVPTTVGRNGYKKGNGIESLDIINTQGPVPESRNCGKKELTLNPLAKSFVPNVLSDRLGGVRNQCNYTEDTSFSDSIFDTTPILNELQTPTLSNNCNKSHISYTTEENSINYVEETNQNLENLEISLLNETPRVRDLSTPTLSESSETEDTCSVTTPKGKTRNNCLVPDATKILKDIRVKNVNRIIIGTLNINSLAGKFEQLKLIIGNYLDIFVIQETKLDASYPDAQFVIPGYSKPYRLDRNRFGGGVMIYVREDIPSRPLHKHKFKKEIEGLFVEINLRKTKLLFFGT